MLFLKYTNVHTNSEFYVQLIIVRKGHVTQSEQFPNIYFIMSQATVSSPKIAVDYV